MDPTKGLSISQQDCLLKLLWRSRMLLERDRRAYWKDFVIGGVAHLAWKPGGKYGEMQGAYTRSDAASICRTLRRLKARGLVESYSDIRERGRTTMVYLTPTGYAVAEQLAQEGWGKDWWERQTVNNSRYR